MIKTESETNHIANWNKTQRHKEEGQMIERDLGFQHPSISDTSDMQEVDRVIPTTIGVHATPYEASRLIYQGTKPWLTKYLACWFSFVGWGWTLTMFFLLGFDDFDGTGSRSHLSQNVTCTHMSHQIHLTKDQPIAPVIWAYFLMSKKIYGLVA